MFKFKQFFVDDSGSALKVGTDAVVLGAAMTVPESRAAAAASTETDGSVHKPTVRMLDIGTGCGVIALMAAQRCPGAIVEAIDIDASSVQDATRNFAASPWRDSLSAKCISLQELSKNFTAPPIEGRREASKENNENSCTASANKADWRYDCIFSNPPFFENSLLCPSERRAGSRHTLELSYRDILNFAAAALSPAGTLSMILPASAETDLLREASARGLQAFRILYIRSTPTKSPSRIIAEFRRSKTVNENAFTSGTLTLMENGHRSSEYTQLAEDFYL